MTQKRKIRKHPNAAAVKITGIGKAPPPKAPGTPPSPPSANAMVQNCMFEQIGIKHTPETRAMIEVIARAAASQADANETTAEAIRLLAQSIGGPPGMGAALHIGTDGHTTIAGCQFEGVKDDA